MNRATVPIEPPPSAWSLPAATSGDTEVVGVGADLEPGTILEAYRSGLFPMRLGRGGPVGWWSPDPRGVLPIDGMRVTRSLRKSCRRFEIRIDTAFEAVMRACGEPHRADGWIDESFVQAYLALYRLGWVHSVETWREGNLVGGLYGVSIGGLFAGESMFHRERDASKVALVALMEVLSTGASLLDLQWATPHLESLGAIALPRRDFLARLERAISQPGPRWPDA